MSITSTKLVNYSCGLDEDLKRTYTLVYRVRTSTASEPITSIRDAPEWAVKVSTYSLFSESDPAAVCNGIDVQQEDDDGRSYTVTVTFGYIEQTPQFEAPVYSYDYAERTVLVDYDIEGNPITNSAGDPFEEAIEKPQHNRVISIQRKDSVPAAVWDGYNDAVNSDTFLGSPAGTIRCNGVTGSSQVDPETGEIYYNNTYVFEYRPEGWVSRRLDQGLRALDGNNKLLKIKGSDRIEVTEPQLLDGEGKELNPIDPNTGQRTYEEDPPPPVFLEFEIYPQLPFGVFGF